MIQYGCMSTESLSLVNPLESKNLFPETDLVEKVLPTPLRDAIALTGTTLRTLLVNEAAPPNGVKVDLQPIPILNFDKQDLGLTLATFRILHSQPANVDEQLKSSLEVVLVHKVDKPDFVELRTHVRIEDTQIYELGENAVEHSTIILTPPIRLPKERDIPVFDMRLIKISDDAKKHFRDELAYDIDEGYPYLKKGQSFVDGKRKVRIQGKPLKSPVAA